MNDKISFPDLVTLLSAKLDITKKEAEAFLKEFFTLATEVITSGEELRVDGLGKFKPIWVESRTGVNVQTGEPVEIPGHYRLSFLPDKVLRDAVNAPFSSFAVEVLNDHVSLEEMLPPEEEPVVESSTEESTEESAPVVEVADPVAEEVAPVAEEVSNVEVEEAHPEHPDNEEPAVEAEDETFNDVGCCGDVFDDDLFYEAYDIENPRKKKYRQYFWRGVWSGVGVSTLVWLLLAVGLFIWGRNGDWKIGSYSSSVSQDEAVEAIAPSQPDSVALVEVTDTIPTVAIDSLSSDTIQVVEVKAEPKKETIRSGLFLTTLSLRHFGHKAFWVYIYEENKAIIKNPDQIPIGTEIVIPEASKYGIDANSQASIDAAKELARKIKEK